MALAEHLALLPQEVQEVVQRRDRRSRRWRHLSYLWEWSSRKRVRRCMRARQEQARWVELGYSGEAESRTASIRGLQRCASIHSCPVCAPRIRHGRALEIEFAARRHLELGGGLAFATLTIPHGQSHALAGLVDAVVASWQSLQKSRTMQALNAEHGIRLVAREGTQGSLRLGQIRALETTHGVNGWHPHLHVLLFLRRPLSSLQVESLQADLSWEWRCQVEPYGYGVPHRLHGVDVQPVTESGTLGQYLSKLDGQTIDRELARSDLKRSRGGRSPWQILSDAVLWGDSDDRDLWWEYEYAMHRRNAITWSHGLKRRFGVSDVDDAALAEESTGHVTRLWLGGSIWGQVLDSRLCAPLLSAVESDDHAEVVAVLTLAGVTDWSHVWWGEPPPSPPDPS